VRQKPGRKHRSEETWSCSIASGDTAPDFSSTIGCKDDFTALASEPLNADIPGATSAKTIIDKMDPGGKNPLYFQNSKKYPIHWNFASTHLSGNGKPVVSSLSQFNTTEYYTPDRRFVRGAITRYAGPGVWTYEIAPYDNASVQIIAMAYQKIADSCFFGDSLYFHPTSSTIEKLAAGLPSSVKIITTDELFKSIDYQPLNFGTSLGRLVFITAKELDTGYVGFRDIVVLDEVPNDISVTSGIITQMFHTPLAQMLADTQFQSDPAVRSARLQALRDSMKVAPVDAAFMAALMAKLQTDYPNVRMRFRSSTNAEDLKGFTGAGLYTSVTGDPNDHRHPVIDALREVWSSVWYFRAFEERSYRNIDHLAAGMAFLVIRSFPDEEATGVAITNNPYT
jgi:hypothetical protein